MYYILVHFSSCIALLGSLYFIVGKTHKLPVCNSFIFLQHTIHLGDCTSLIGNDGDLHASKSSSLTWNISPTISILVNVLLNARTDLNYKVNFEAVNFKPTMHDDWSESQWSMQALCSQPVWTLTFCRWKLLFPLGTQT